MKSLPHGLECIATLAEPPLFMIICCDIWCPAHHQVALASGEFCNVTTVPNPRP